MQLLKGVIRFVVSKVYDEGRETGKVGILVMIFFTLFHKINRVVSH